MTTMTPTQNEFSAFKEADIRGVYPREINEELVYLIARAFVERSLYKKVLVARDMRLSSPALRDAFVQGATDAGATVVDLGLTTTPMLYFASGSLALPGAMITASHSPKEHNGLKLVMSGAVPLTEKTGLKDIRTRISRGHFVADAKKRGAVVVKDIMPTFTRYMHGLLKKPKAPATPARIVVDCGNGMGSLLLPQLASMGCEVTALGATLDGTFPERGSNPTLPKNQRAIVLALKKGGYDFGIAFDGDADRVAFFDERGQFVNCGAVGALIAERFLAQRPKSRMVATVLTSRAFGESVLRAGGRVDLARVGHSYVKEVLRKKQAVFGCEHSGHFFYKDFFYTDSLLLTFHHVLSAYREGSVAFSQLLAPYTGFFQTEDLMIETVDKNKTMQALLRFLNKQKPQKLVEFDGITADFGTAWVVVKPSVTEAAINIIAEAPSKKAAVALRDMVLAEAGRVA